MLDTLRLEEQMKTIFFTICVFMFFVTSVNATVYHFFNGKGITEAAMEWEEARTNSKEVDLLLVSEYVGYVGALFDHLSEKQHICTPDEITKNDVLQVVSDYLKYMIKGSKNAGSVQVEAALYKQYSCTK